MRIYLAVVAKHCDADIDRASTVARSVIEYVFPVPMDTVTSEEWSGVGSALLAWSNEGPALHRPPLMIKHEEVAVGVSGNLAQQDDLKRMVKHAVLGEVTDNMGGCFSAFRAAPQEVQAATASTRAFPVFYAENQDFHIVGNRALHVNLVVTGGRVLWDKVALQSMIRQGYFISEETPYAGVSALEPSSSILLRGRNRSIKTIPFPQAHVAPTSARGKRKAISRLADALISAVEPLRATAEPVNLALTGGRDSRLMAALLRAARIPFRVTTNGLDNHPDVVIARLIAKRLRVDHTVIPPVQTEQKDALLIPHPRERTYEVLRTCEGMTSAYESIVEYLPYSARPTMSGQSGEILRGGFLYSQGQTTDKAMRRRVNDFFFKNESLFTEEANAHARTLAAPWLAKVGTDPWEVLDHMYVTYRVGRWHAAARAGSLRRGDPVQPFLDNRVVVEALSLSQQWRHSEEVVYELIRRFAPGLEKIELEGTPWRFMAGAKKPRWNWPWSSHKPSAGMPTKKSAAAWNWRTSPGPVLSELLSSYILERADTLADLVRPDELKAFFAAPVVSQAALAWNLYTVAFMLTEAFPCESSPGLDPVRVEIVRSY
jgi:hypothetical protein